VSRPGMGAKPWLSRLTFPQVSYTDAVRALLKMGKFEVLLMDGTGLSADTLTEGPQWKRICSLRNIVHAAVWPDCVVVFDTSYYPQVICRTWNLS